MKRFPRVQTVVAEPCDSMAGDPGPPAHIFIFVSQLPTKCSRRLWASPGVARAMKSCAAAGAAGAAGAPAFLLSFFAFSCAYAQEARSNPAATDTTMAP